MKALTVDPQIIGGAALYNDIGNGFYLNSSPGSICMRSTGYHNIVLNSIAVGDLQNHVNASESWWAVGFQESGDNDPWGEFDGYDNLEPSCTVTYTIPSIQVLVPNGNECWAGGNQHNIQYGIS